LIHYNYLLIPSFIHMIKQFPFNVKSGTSCYVDQIVKKKTEYEADKKERLGEAAAQPHRIKYRKLKRD